MLVISALAAACLNDRDSLLAGQRDLYSRSEVLTGWFDRNPPRYYEMRIERLEKQPKLSPVEMDDLAVAYERMGNSRKAIQVIERKLKIGKPGYTYYANHGTFLIHDWLKNGTQDLAQAKQAEKEIAKAIEINPAAHGGREGAQLEAIRWLIRFKSGEKDPPSYGEAMIEAAAAKAPKDFNALYEGLVGLIELGGAWEAVDHYAAIAKLRFGSPESDVAHFRAKELLAAGKKPLFPEGAKRDLARKVVEPAPGISQEAYDIARKDAERRHQLRNQYMEARFAKGQHPDTDPNFWNAWVEPKRTPLKRSKPIPLSPELVRNYAIGTVICGACAAVVVLALRRRRSRYWE